MRASDADRERAVSRLSSGYADGQLGTDTFARRIDLAYQAGSAGDLRALTADLPRRFGEAVSDLLESCARALTPARRAEPPSVWLAPPTHSDGPWTIGRDLACDLQIADETVSRRHAELRWTPEGYLLRDLSSNNGSRANGVRVSAVLVRPGDVVMLGRVRVRLARRG